MKNLILLFIRYGGFIFFLLLEMFCLFLVVRYNRTQNEIYVNSSNILSGKLNTKVADITRYFSLTSTSDSLAMENARLYSKISNLNKNTLLLTDSTYIEEDSIAQYLFISARVVNNSTTRNNNFLTINKGKEDGIKIRQGVISDKGLVGIIRSVSANYAVILSILHRQVRINAAIRRTNNFGMIAWRGTNPTIVKLENIPTHAKPMLGDTIVTAMSSRFPKGITLGIIDTFWRAAGSNFYDIDVKLTNDLNSLEHVYVIDNKNQEEQEQLEEQVINE